MEQWIRWEPLDGIVEKYLIHAVVCVRDQLIVDVVSFCGRKKIRIVFDECIDTYRYADYRLHEPAWQKLVEQCRGDAQEVWSFFKITNSNYIQWLADKSDEYAAEFPFQHVCIVGDRDILDVAMRIEPKITIKDL